MTTQEDIAIQFRSLRTQLSVLEARLRASPAQTTHRLPDLQGILRDQSQCTKADIDAALYQVRNEDER
jgi:hypothetical protein